MKLQSENNKNGSEPLSRKELENYLDGNLSNREMHKLEKKILDNDLNSDAMEGYEAVPGAVNGLNDLNNRFNQKMAKNTGRTSHRLQWVFGSLLAFGLLAGLVWFVYWFTDMGNQSYKKLTENGFHVITKGISYEDYLKSVPLTEKQKADLDEIDKANEIDKKEQISYSDIIQPEREKTKVNADNKELDGIADDDIEDDLPVNSVEANEGKSEEPPCVSEKSYNVPKKNKSDLLIVDYTRLKRREDARLKPYFSGTSAAFENNDDRDRRWNEYNEVESMSYVDFLDDCMKNLRTGSYKTALMDFKVILDKYPSDLNAHFYGGLCYYNIGKPVKAIEHFEYVLKDTVNLFDEPAQFYLALSYNMKGEKTKAQEMLRKIANEPCHFYRKRAEKELEEIKD